METEALGSEGGEQGDWTQSHVKGQRIYREQSPHTKGQGGARWGREGRPRRRGHAGNQS